MRLHGQTTATIAASPEAVFARITDLARLPEWNAAMRWLPERPSQLEPGTEWVVEFGVLGRRWLSRSRCEVIDPERRQFTYRSQTDDGNPSYVRWQWAVDEVHGGTTVRVGWELHPTTFWRRVLLARVRARQLAREVPASLDALARATVSARP
jgi:uncharacterized protein YndB with AHSA1/START domain